MPRGSREFRMVVCMATRPLQKHPTRVETEQHSSECFESTVQIKYSVAGKCIDVAPGTLEWIALKVGMGPARLTDGLNDSATSFNCDCKLGCPPRAINNGGSIPPCAYIVYDISHQQFRFAHFYFSTGQAYLCSRFLGLFEAGSQKHSLGEVLPKKPHRGL